MPTADFLVEMGGMIALAGWAILIFGPRRFAPLFFIPQFAIPGLLAFAYGGLMLAFYFPSGGGYGSLAEIRTLFQSDYVLAAGWIHYLAFDLFIGAWIARRSDAAQIPRLIQTVFLLATFLFGPAGLLLFLLTRTFLSGLLREARA